MNIRKLVNISNILIVGIVALFGTISCSHEEGYFTVSGKITHAEGKMIYLEELQVSSSAIIDSVKINKNSEFRFTGHTGIPVYFLLKLSENKFITLLVDSAEQIFIEADAANFERNYRVEGSMGSLQVKTLNDFLAQTRKKLDSINSLQNIYKGNPDYLKMKTVWDTVIDSIKNNQTKFSNQFVMNNPFSMASVLALYQRFDDTEYIVNDLQTMRVAASALNTIYPGSEHVKALYQNTLQLIQEEKNARLRQIIQEQGQNSPEVVLPNPEGKEIALSSLRGKIVLLHFWSSMDRDSRILNEALLEAYTKFNKKGFEIYQVSVDKNRMEWIDAIDRDGLKWINVGDMEGSIRAVNFYNIKTIPYNYLLNENGEIIAQNLRGPDLNTILSRLLH
ncbi:MAG: TlpA disulfide reductase family protein [Mariniphaga sp.]|nr:TlpA disulfide reductase family protein [Mariniphaga sp.]MDD4426142.1 TlpA disulfide reductase family protein [Mariniphaga sp.]